MLKCSLDQVACRSLLVLEEVSSAGILEEVEDLFNALRRARPSWNLLLNINLWLPDQLLLELLLVIAGSFEEAK